MCHCHLRAVYLDGADHNGSKPASLPTPFSFDLHLANDGFACVTNVATASYCCFLSLLLLPLWFSAAAGVRTLRDRPEIQYRDGVVVTVSQVIVDGIDGQVLVASQLHFSPPAR